MKTPLSGADDSIPQCDDAVSIPKGGAAIRGPKDGGEAPRTIFTTEAMVALSVVPDATG